MEKEPIEEDEEIDADDVAQENKIFIDQTLYFLLTTDFIFQYIQYFRTGKLVINGHKEPIEEDEEIDADDVAQENKGLTEEEKAELMASRFLAPCLFAGTFSFLFPALHPIFP